MERPFRLNCTAATFPLLSSYFGRSALTRAPEDSNYVITNAYSGAQADRDIGIPMPLYMHNVLPTTQGLASVGYRQLVASQGAAVKTFDQAFIVRTTDDSRYMFVPAQGANYMYDSLDKRWLLTGFPTTKPGMVTKAYLHKQTYICYQHQGIYTFNEISGTFELVTIPGLDPAFVEGITQCNNYLVAFTPDTLFWTSPTDLNMTPSLATTAGSEMVLDLAGPIVCCLPTSEGFNIYTTANVVSAKYSNNVRFPWKFDAIAGSSGVTRPEHVTSDSTNDLQYCWSTNGMLAIGKGQATGVFPEVTDFLSGHLLEDYTGSTGRLANSNISGQWSGESQSWGTYPLGPNNLIQFSVQGQLQVKLAVIANRWLVISYGATRTLEWALVYDQLLKRWGKLRVPHVHCMEFSTANRTNVEHEVNHTFAFLQETGAVLAVDLEDGALSTDSVLIFGRLQHTRGRVLTLQALEVENGRPGEMQLSVLTSLDGRNWLPDHTPLPQIQTRNLTKWLLRKTGINHCFKLTGTFDVVTLQGSCTIGGAR